MDIPCALSSRERTLLRTLTQGKKVAELGALLGGSTAIIASGANAVFSVDRHEGYGPSTLRSYLSNLDRLGLRNIVTPIVADIADCRLPAGLEAAFIDLDGSYPTTRLALLKTASIPLLLLHDVSRQSCSGVAKAIAESGRKGIFQVDTLAVVV